MERISLLYEYLSKEVFLMNIKVCKLTKDMADDYIDYFEHRAFSDENIQKGCYCV